MNTILKLKKVLSRRDRDLNREYHRYDVTIPNNVIDELKWQNTNELKYKVSGKKLVIEKE